MPTSKSPSKWLILVLSALVPGLGQVVQRKYRTGIYIFLAFLTSLAVVFWYTSSNDSASIAWYLVPGVIWAWNLANNWLPKGMTVLIPVAVWLIMAYGIGADVTNFDLAALFNNAGRASMIINQMAKPDFVQPRTVKQTGFTEIESPCSTSPQPPRHTTGEITVSIVQPCANVGDVITIVGTGFWPNVEAQIAWINPIGGQAMDTKAMADANGRVELNWLVLPIVHSTAPDPTIPQIHQVKITQSKPIGGIELSSTGGYVLQGIAETLGLAFLATVVGAILAIPFGFLAARNLMTGSPIGTFVYMIVRTVLNITRSIEALIMAIIFVLIVGLGPFPGMIALAIHTTAALGKLYSEVIEGIDPGPIEAVRATGASGVQVIRYAVIPQIVPAFTALTIYRWDINVRMSTIIGFVGGGGIGFFLWQWMNLYDFRAVGAAFIAIAVVVIAMDFLSGRIRERLV